MPAAAIPKPNQDSSDETDDAMLTPREIVEHLDKNIVGQVQDTSPPIWQLMPAVLLPLLHLIP